MNDEPDTMNRNLKKCVYRGLEVGIVQRQHQRKRNLQKDY